MSVKPARASTYTSKNTCCIRHNNPQSAYALHILQHWHQYGSIDQTMTLLKPVTNTSLLTHYELFFIQSLGHTKKLIPEQHTSDPNPLFQLAFKPPSWPNQSGHILCAVHTSNSPALHNPDGFPSRQSLHLFHILYIYTPLRHLPNHTHLHLPPAPHLPSTQHPYNPPKTPTNSLPTLFYLIHKMTYIHVQPMNLDCIPPHHEYHPHSTS
jgi:hypothetical protein